MAGRNCGTSGPEERCRPDMIMASCGFRDAYSERYHALCSMAHETYQDNDTSSRKTKAEGQKKVLKKVTDVGIEL